MVDSKDTIAAIATPPGRGGVGIVRISGPGSHRIATQMLGFSPTARHAHYTDFFDEHANLIDSGLALFFPCPHSFTGEDVVEFQGHGGPVILDMVLAATCRLGARMARPGEFSERAFLNDKLDLAQAEAISDLINASSQQAARQAVQSLKGGFSEKINELLARLIELRKYVESAIDFPEEEIDFLNDGHIARQLREVIAAASSVFEQARQGSLIREGMKVVIAGRPNAGKSSLLNALSERDSAIVTNIAGTTRDVLREHIQIDGMPLHIIDTAGLRHHGDEVEQIGIERAWHEIRQADRILLLLDTTDPEQLNYREHWQELLETPEFSDKLTLLFNKIDQTNYPPPLKAAWPSLGISAKTGEGLLELKNHLKSVIGLNTTAEGSFSARRRHLDAITRALQSLEAGRHQLELAGAGELLAEDLRCAQQALSEVTGRFDADDLLGEIFSSFCIGK